MTTPGVHESSPFLEKGSPTSLLPDGPEIPPHSPIMDDLYGVGPDKPLGYLPTETIYGCGEHPEVVGDLSQRRGLSTFAVREDEVRVRSGALYVYDEKALDFLLREQASILAAGGWPVNAAEFVRRVSHETVDVKRDPDLFRVIAWAFRDPRPEYQRSGSISISTARPESSALSLVRAKLLGWVGLRK